jgi:hypothetical protein
LTRDQTSVADSRALLSRSEVQGDLRRGRLACRGQRLPEPVRPGHDAVRELDPRQAVHRAIVAIAGLTEYLILIAQDGEATP